MDLEDCKAVIQNEGSKKKSIEVEEEEEEEEEEFESSYNDSNISTYDQLFE